MNTQSIHDTDTAFLEKEQRYVRIAAGKIAVQFLREFDSTWLYENVCANKAHTIGELMRTLAYWPEDRGRKPAMSFAKIGSVVFGPALPTGQGESVYRIESRKGKKQKVVCMRDGRPESSTEVGKMFNWHSDNNMAVFGRPNRGELVRVRNELKSLGIWS